MSVGQVSGSPLPVGSYWNERQADLAQMGRSLVSGDKQGVQQAYDAIVSLGGQVGGGMSFSDPTREHDFQAIGQALQSGNMSAAAQAYRALSESFHRGQDPSPVSVSAPMPAIGDSDRDGDSK
jgi:hypothetical protein